MTLLAALQEFAQRVAELSPSGMRDGIEVLLADEQWDLAERELTKRTLLRPSPSFMGEVEEPGERGLREAQPPCIILYTPAGKVTIRRGS